MTKQQALAALTKICAEYDGALADHNTKTFVFLTDLAGDLNDLVAECRDAALLLVNQSQGVR